MTDLKDLKELAEAAADVSIVETDTGGAFRTQMDGDIWGRFVSAAAPETVLELIARVEAAEGEPSEVLEGVTEDMTDAYVIMKRGYYYRPKAAGYTSVLAEAGRFSLEEAKAYSNDEPPRVTYKRLEDAKELSAGATTEVQLDYAQKKIASLRTALEQAKAREAELLGALEPFAKLAEFWLERASIHHFDDEDTCATEIEFGHLRNAVTAMGGDDNG